MRRLTIIFGWLAIVMIVVILTLGILILLDSQPLVESDHALTDAERAWVRQWVKTNRPRNRQSEELITLALSEREINLLAGALLDRIGQGRAAVRLEEGRLHLAASLGLPWNPLNSFVNLELTLIEKGDLATVETARLAGLPIPGLLTRTLAERALAAVEKTQAIQRVELQRDQVRMTYEWRSDLLERLGSGLVTAAELPHLLRYQEYLEQRVATLPAGRPLALADLLGSLLAKAGTQPATADPIVENRALILVLAAYVNGHAIRDPAGSHSAIPHRSRAVLLRGRRDLSRHFMTSAALAIQGNDALSGIVGWYKEMSDADRGSGFSFADMAANRTGIRLARVATASQDSARQVQRSAMSGLTDDDFMPAIDGLPEGMNQQAVASRFNGSGKIEYDAIMTHIDQRIDACRVFRELPQ